MTLIDKDKNGFAGRHRWLVITLAVVLAVILLASFTSMREEVIPVRAATVERSSIRTAISTNGKIEPAQNFEAHAPVSTTVRRLLVRHPELTDQAAERARLLERVQVLTLDVLDEGDRDRRLIRDAANERRDLRQSGHLRGTPVDPGPGVDIVVYGRKPVQLNGVNAGIAGGVDPFHPGEQGGFIARFAEALAQRNRGKRVPRIGPGDHGDSHPPYPATAPGRHGRLRWQS